MEDPRKVVEAIRATKFGIGSFTKNPLAVDMHESIRQLAANLYQKDLHFVMELVQNADDNTYPEGVVPELEFVLVEADVGGVGVDWTLLVLNNEVGFSKANVESLCSIGRSTKKGRRDSGYIGEKGIGFKSVFLVTHHPIVISNGFRIRFNDAPTHDTELGFIVPEWADQPTDAELAECLNINEGELPNTIIVLPICQDKVQAMREQLFQLSPQLVLFLNKIGKLSARQISSKGSAGASSMSKGMLVQRHTTPAPSECAGMIPNNCSYSTVRLSSSTRETVYHVWQQEFPVEVEHEVDERRGVHTLMTTLAFPIEENTNDDAEPDIYAFLPTNFTAGFPFIINADFLLVSSRDTIRFDSQWNKCILSHIPHAFMAAFVFLLKTADFSLGSASLRDVYTYVPCDELYIGELGFVREAIIKQIKAHNTIFCDENIGQHFPAGPGLAEASVSNVPNTASYFFCHPALARTIDPKFRSLLKMAHSAKLPPPKPLTFQRMYVVDEDVQDTFEGVLETLGVECFSPELYVVCLRSPNWLMSLPDAMYVELLKLLCDDLVASDCILDLPLVKYLDDQNKVQLLAPRDKDVVSVYISKKHKDVSILTQWTPIFQRWMSVHFMPNSTVRAMVNSKDSFSSLCDWLKRIAGIRQLSVKTYVQQLCNMFKDKKVVLQDEASLVLGTMHFILHAVQEGEDEYADIFSEFPLLDRSGDIYFNFKGPVLLPASVSKWPKYLLNDAWNEHILCLSESYFELPPFMVDCIGSDCVPQFLRQAVSAGDIFDIKSPPDAPLFIPSPWGLTASDVKLFLSWIKGLAYIPNKLKTSLKESYWVKTVEHGDKKPSMSFLDVGGQWSNVFTRKDVPFVDTRFYGDLRSYCSILNELGMVTKMEDGAQAVAEHMQQLSMAGFYEVQSDSANRWYKYLRSRSWMGWARSKSLKVIWVPDGRRGSSLGSWWSAHDCVISDSGGLFHDRVFVLNKYYKDEGILQFFRDNMGVAATPGTEKYCQLWVDLGEKKGTVDRKECENAWSMIAKDWQSFNRKANWEVQTFMNRCRIPYWSGAQQEADTVALARPTEVLYADNLILAEIFSKACPCPKFAWYPRSAVAAVTWMEDLVKCYTDLGVKPLSQALMGGGSATYTSKIKRPPVISQKGEVGKGIYRAILGYLADPKHRLTAQARKRMVMQLKTVEVCHVDEVGEVECRVLAGGKVYHARRAAHVRWEKGEKKIYVAMPAGCSKAQVGHELAGELAKGVVGGEKVFLVEGLQELLGSAAGYNFDDNAVQYLLSLRNLRLTLEDEALLQEQQLETSATHYL